jgi:hypothetical protein
MLDQLEVVTESDVPLLPTAPSIAVDLRILGLPARGEGGNVAQDDDSILRKAFRNAIMTWHPDVMMRRLTGRVRCPAPPPRIAHRLRRCSLRWWVALVAGFGRLRPCLRTVPPRSPMRTAIRTIRAPKNAACAMWLITRCCSVTQNSMRVLEAAERLGVL